MSSRNYSKIAKNYAEGVTSGIIPACRLVQLSCQRHLDDLDKWKTDKNYPYEWSKEACFDICDFGEHMVHTRGSLWVGKCIHLEPWQVFFLGVPFGWLKKSTGFRRFSEIYGEIPRKNGKSPMGAIIGNYMFSRDGELGAEVYSGAATEKQAWEVFKPAKIMTQKAEGYKEAFGIHINAKSLVIESSGSKFEPVIGNPGDGSSPHCAIIDEYHEHKTSEQYDTMSTGTMARTQSMIVIITTAGYNIAGPCYEKRKQVIDMLNGVVRKDSLFSLIYTIDEEDDWTDFNVWKKANPNFGVSVLEDKLYEAYDTAMHQASQQNSIKCKHLNIWSNANTAWMNMVAWNKCKKNVRLEDFIGCKCWVGIDLASKVDIAAKMLLFERERAFYIFGKYYLPKDTIERPENDHYQKWLAEGHIIETPGAAIDFGFIEEDLIEDAKRFDIQEVPYDPFQATQFAVHMLEIGLPMVEFGATVKNFSEPMKNLEALTLEGKIVHDGDPVLTWMMSNVVAHYDAKDNIYPRKDHPDQKIDGPVAGIMALGRATLGVIENSTSIYEARDMVFL